MKIITNRLIMFPVTENLIISIKSREYQLGDHIYNYIDELKKDSSLLGYGVWLVFHRETNQIIGDIGFKGKPDNQNTIEIGYGIQNTEQGKGYATEAVIGIIDWAFSTKKVDKIRAECLDNNFASIRVLEKVGMSRVSEDNGMIYWEYINSKENMRKPMG